MNFYILVHEERRNTYTQPILAKSNKNCGNYKRKNYRQWKKVITIQKCVICFRIHNFLLSYIFIFQSIGDPVLHIMTKY